jgi:hypothetical protein
MRVKRIKYVFDSILNGGMGEDEFAEWLSDYTEEVVQTAKTASEIDLTPLREWANSDEPVWDSFEVGYETARIKARKLLGDSGE